eukprot:c6134_g1_i1.p1 GENE.c6134_g1_i1~~c6134_g1_i1.p1  ORF type:complete len:351 (+),score=84.57 c6134_g1_i1:54-1106(+)
MGGCSSTPEQTEAKKIDVTLRKDQEIEKKVVKLLLLGAGDSGKSTILKQMRIISGSGFTDDERRTFISVINRNILENMQRLTTGCAKLGIFMDTEVKELAVILDNASPQESRSSYPLQPELAVCVKKLWSSKPIQEAYRRRVEFQLDDSASYFFEDIDRFSAPHFLPVPQDILRTRIRTTGITNYEFVSDGQKFQMFDVGGQRNERRKWIHCFEGVKAVLFVVALSEYDQRLFEDDTTNRMLEALTLFGEISNSPFFVKSALILFLNKSDLLQTKILEKNITDAFPDYTGPQTYDHALQYIEERFRKANRSKKEPYVHVTNATDTENIAFVFAAVRDTMLKSNLESSGFM